MHKNALYIKFNYYFSVFCIRNYNLWCCAEELIRGLGERERERERDERREDWEREGGREWEGDGKCLGLSSTSLRA